MVGKMMEKAGGMLKNERLVEKGQQKRGQANEQDGSSASGNTGSNYGNNDNNY
jgi:hypothetical protein